MEIFARKLNEVKLVILRLKNILAGLSTFIQNKFLARLNPITPAQLKIFYIGGYWRGQNDMVSQMLQRLKTLGVNVCEFNTDENHDAIETDNLPYDRGTSSPVWLVREKLFPFILRFRPHLIICNAGGLSFRLEDGAFLRKLGIKLLGIALSDPDVYETTTSKIAKNFDVFYSNNKGCVDLYRRSGARSYHLPIATNPDFFRPVQLRPEYICDVLLLGAVHPDRIEPVHALVEHFDTHVHGENWEKYGITNRGFVFGEDALSALSSAKMAVIFSRTISGYQGIKVGVFDFLSAGCLVVTDDIPELHEYFIAGKEIVTFKDTQDLLYKIRYYLDHPQEADEIRKAGREKVINNYTWDKVWPKVLASIIQVDGWTTIV